MGGTNFHHSEEKNGRVQSITNFWELDKCTMEAIMAKDVLLAYPGFSKKFAIHMDASHTQLKAAISQNGKPTTFYSRKLNGAQTQYTTTE